MVRVLRGITPLSRDYNRWQQADVIISTNTRLTLHLFFECCTRHKGKLVGRITTKTRARASERNLNSPGGGGGGGRRARAVNAPSGAGADHRDFRIDQLSDVWEPSLLGSSEPHTLSPSSSVTSEPVIQRSSSLLSCLVFTSFFLRSPPFYTSHTIICTVTGPLYSSYRQTFIHFSLFFSMNNYEL